jgi:UDP-GlcNAc3NAcA epimerase
MAKSGQKIVLPLHPRTKARLMSTGIKLPDNILTIEPVGYLDMVMLEKYASKIVTDSGGVQKEAFFYQVPCITLRDETEWVELVEADWNYLVPPVSSEAITIALMTDYSAGNPIQPYGEGRAAELIAERFAQC